MMRWNLSIKNKYPSNKAAAKKASWRKYNEYETKEKAKKAAKKKINDLYYTRIVKK